MKPYLGEAHNTHGWSWIYTYDKNVIKYTMQLFATNFDKEYPLSDLPLSWLNTITDVYSIYIIQCCVSMMYL